MKNSGRREGEATAEVEQSNIHLFLSAELRKTPTRLTPVLRLKHVSCSVLGEGGVIVSDLCGLSDFSLGCAGLETGLFCHLVK